MFATSVNANIRSAVPALLEEQPGPHSEGRLSAQPSFTCSVIELKQVLIDEKKKKMKD